MNEGFIINYQKHSSNDNYFIELNLIETNIVIENIFTMKSKPIFLSGGIGKTEIFEKFLKYSKVRNIIISRTEWTDDNLQQNVYLTNISNTNLNNNSFYGEIIMKLCKVIPDGMICYFSSFTLMEYYIKKWNEQGVFEYILNDKLLYIEEQDSFKLSRVITNYKKACEMGRGAIFFLSTRNKATLFDHSLNSHFSRCIVFIGFPIETKLSKTFELKLEFLKKNYDLDSKDYLNYDTFRLFSNKVVEKIKDITDKKVLVILDEKLISDKLKHYLPVWLHKLVHIDFDKENVNTDERIKNIKNFLSE
jgi:DNA excision repair protein ERCC-2